MVSMWIDYGDSRYYARDDEPVHQGWREDPEIPRFGADDPPDYDPNEDYEDWPEEER